MLYMFDFLMINGPEMEILQRVNGRRINGKRAKLLVLIDRNG